MKTLLKFLKYRVHFLLTIYISIARKKEIEFNETRKSLLSKIHGFSSKDELINIINNGY